MAGILCWFKSGLANGLLEGLGCCMVILLPLAGLAVAQFPTS